MTLGGGNQTSTSFLASRSIFFRVKAPAGGLSLFSLTKCILFSGDAVSIKVVQDIHHSSSRLQMAVTAYLLRHLMNSVPGGASNEPIPLHTRSCPPRCYLPGLCSELPWDTGITGA